MKRKNSVKSNLHFQQSTAFERLRLHFRVTERDVAFFVTLDGPRRDDDVVPGTHPDAAADFARHPAHTVLAVAALHAHACAAGHFRDDTNNLTRTRGPNTNGGVGVDGSMGAMSETHIRTGLEAPQASHTKVLTGAA